MKKILAGILCLVMMLCMMPATQVNAEDGTGNIEINSYADADAINNNIIKVEFNAGVMTITLLKDIDGYIYLDIDDTTVDGNANSLNTVRLDANGKTVSGISIDDNGTKCDVEYVLTGDGTCDQLRVAGVKLSIESVTVKTEINLFGGYGCTVVASRAGENDFAVAKIKTIYTDEIFFTDDETGRCTIEDSRQLQAGGLTVKQYKNGDPVDIGDTGDIRTVSELGSKLGCIADITENNDGSEINIKLNYNLIGRMSFLMQGKTIILDANGKTVDGGSYGEPICVQHNMNGTLVLTGNGTYLAGENNVLFSGIGGEILVKSGTFDRNGKNLEGSIFNDINGTIVANVDTEKGYNCFVITDSEENQTIYYDETNLSWNYNDNTGSYIVKQHIVADSWSTDENDHWKGCTDSDCGEKLVKAKHTYGDVNKCDICGYEKQASVPVITAPAITTHPANASVNVGETATFTVVATGTDLSYQWQIDRNDGNGFVNITNNATSASYTTSIVTENCNGFTYRCVVSNSAAAVTTNSATLAVKGAETGGSGAGTATPVPTYTIIEGKDGAWTQGTTETVTVRADGDFTKFAGVKVNDTLIDTKHYTAVSGSTVVTLKQEYLDTLAEGTYKLTVVFTDGECSTNFQIQKAAQTNPEPPTNSNAGNDNQQNNATNTGDQSNIGATTPPASDGAASSPKTGDNSSGYIVMLMISGSIIVGLNLYNSRRKNQ